MGSILCNMIISESAVVLLKTPSQTSASVALTISTHPSYIGLPINAQLTTDCPYLNIPSANYLAGTLAVPGEYLFTFDLSTFSGEGVSLCGTITVGSNEEGCVTTIEIPVYIWSIKDMDDVQDICGALMPSSIHVDKQDSSTWEQFIPIVRVSDPGTLGANASISDNGCDYSIIDYEGAQGENGGSEYQLNNIGESVVFPVSFTEGMGNFEECGESILACTFKAYQSYQLAGPPVECEAIIPLYVTNICDDGSRACPISWSANGDTIQLDPNNLNGSFINAITNSDSIETISVQFSASNPLLSVANNNPLTLAPGETFNFVIGYDLFGYTACGVQLIGTVSATVTYGEQETCMVAFNVFVNYDCPEDTQEYLTSVHDEDALPTVSINDDCSIITILDNSQWGSGGHAMSAFTDYRVITITHLQSGVEHIMSSFYPNDGSHELIDVASTGNLSYFFAMTPGGAYEVQLCNIPTWGSGFPYLANDTVFHNGLLYVAIDDSQSINPSSSPNSPANWVEVTADQIATYTDKYCDSHVVVSSCDLDQCFANKYTDLACRMNCNSLDLCTNKEFLDVLKLEFLIVALDQAILENNMEAAVTIYDKASLICNCS
jgi:hypothetical protein